MIKHSYYHNLNLISILYKKFTKFIVKIYKNMILDRNIDCNG